MSATNKKSWVVKLECVVRKELITDVCTEDEARNEPYLHATDEREIETQDYKVLHVQPNE